MTKNDSIQRMTATALLIALGIAIPLLSPVKIILPPASFTLASHVPIFLGMFVSPMVAAVVAVGTTIGFFLGGFPLVIVLRAATHLVFAFGGALFLKRHPQTLAKPLPSQLYSFVIALLHGACEVAVVSVFFFGGNMGDSWYSSGFFVSIFLLVGVGSVVHSMLDFAISLLIVNVLKRQKNLRALFRNAA